MVFALDEGTGKHRIASAQQGGSSEALLSDSVTLQPFRLRGPKGNLEEEWRQRATTGRIRVGPARV